VNRVSRTFARVPPALLDAACVLLLVVVGTRNHDTDDGILSVLGVGLPFWIALAGVHAVPAVRRTAAATGTGAIVWVATVSGGMLLRNLVFGRGTAAAFVVVATVFLGITMLGWRAARDWRAA
jgi:FtsH-binding integral membrane protein